MVDSKIILADEDFLRHGFKRDGENSYKKSVGNKDFDIYYGVNDILSMWLRCYENGDRNDVINVATICSINAIKILEPNDLDFLLKRNINLI